MFLDPNYIVLLTSIQTLQTASLTLSVPEKNYDKITKGIILKIYIPSNSSDYLFQIINYYLQKF